MFNKKSKKLKRLYKYPYFDNFRKFIDHFCDKYGETDAFIIKIQKETATAKASYRHVTYTEFKKEVISLAAAFSTNGFSDNPIAIIGSNSYPWMVSYFATLYCGAVAVPLDKALPVGEALSSIQRSGAKTLVYGNDMEAIVEELRPTLEQDNISLVKMSDLDDLIGLGHNQIKIGYTDHIDRPIDPNKLAVILFTSGTTSASKAVMLTQNNILINSYDCVTSEPIHHGDVNMAFLPYHHTFGSTGQVVMINAGATTAFCDGLKYVQKNLVEYGVTLFVCVPILIEAIYKRVLANVKKQGKEKQFASALLLTRSLRKIGIDKRRSVFKEVLNQLGGLRFIISGASALDPIACRGLNDLGIVTVQGYGMTEASPVITAEALGNQRLGSVGKAIPSVELKLKNVNDEGIGELLAKGPSIMMGYMDNDEETSKILKDGWLHTGDLALIDNDGYVFIKGRTKNVIVLHNGKNVYPEELEALVSNLPFVEEVMVYGDERHADQDSGGTHLVVTAKIVYNEKFPEEFQGDMEALEKYVHDAIDEINDGMPQYKHIKRLVLTDQPMIKTSTGKIKRHEEENR